MNHFYSAPCKFFTDDIGRPNRINWFPAPEGALIYEDWTTFRPRIDNLGDDPTGLYEFTALRTRQRKYKTDAGRWTVDGTHWHGDHDDFLGLSSKTKYFIGRVPPHDPCGVERLIAEMDFFAEMPRDPQPDFVLSAGLQFDAEFVSPHLPCNPCAEGQTPPFDLSIHFEGFGADGDGILTPDAKLDNGFCSWSFFPGDVGAVYAGSFELRTPNADLGYEHTFHIIVEQELFGTGENDPDNTFFTCDPWNVFGVGTATDISVFPPRVTQFYFNIWAADTVVWFQEENHVAIIDVDLTTIGERSEEHVFVIDVDVGPERSEAHASALTGFPPVAAWDLDGSLADTSGNGHDFTSGSGGYVAGVLGQAYRATGSASAVLAVSGVLSSTAAMSFAWWTKAHALADTTEMMAQADSLGVEITQVFWDPGSNTFDVSNGTSGSSLPGLGIGYDTWTFFALTSDGFNTYFYVNGVLQGSLGGGLVTMTSLVTTFGGVAGSSPALFAGDFDAIVAYDFMLSAAQVTALYNSGAGLDWRDL